MVIITKSFKFFIKGLLVFFILLNFPTTIFAYETYSEAMKWYEESHSLIDPKKNYFIGLKLENDGNKKKALTFFRLAADSGLKEAQIKVGFYLIKSDNPEEQKEARGIFKLLSDKENAIASFKLGWMYENGIGGEKNFHKASQFYKLAASRDQYNAYLYLANLSLADPNNTNILLAASYSTIAMKRSVRGADILLDKLLPLLKNDEIDEIEVLVSSLESEIQKFKTN